MPAKKADACTVRLTMQDRCTTAKRLFNGDGSISEALTAHNIRAKLEVNDVDRGVFPKITGSIHSVVNPGPHVDQEFAEQYKQSFDLEPREAQLWKETYELAIRSKQFPKDDAYVSLYLRVKDALGVEEA